MLDPTNLGTHHNKALELPHPLAVQDEYRLHMDGREGLEEPQKQSPIYAHLACWMDYESL
jgi:hypothetical protein